MPKNSSPITHSFLHPQPHSHTHTLFGNESPGPKPHPMKMFHTFTLPQCHSICELATHFLTKARFGYTYLPMNDENRELQFQRSENQQPRPHSSFCRRESTPNNPANEFFSRAKLNHYYSQKCLPALRFARRGRDSEFSREGSCKRAR